MSNGGAGNDAGRSGDNQNKQSTGDEVKSKRKSARIAQLEAESIPKLSASPEIKEGRKSSKPGSVSGNGNTVFVEPELAAPTPSYTGLPLEEFPSNKIKRNLYGLRNTGELKAAIVQEKAQLHQETK